MKCEKCGKEMKWTKTNREIDGPHAYLTYECEYGHTTTKITLQEHIDDALGISHEDPSWYYDPYDEQPGADDWDYDSYDSWEDLE